MSADARSYLVQQLARFRSAAKQIDKNIKELQADLILVIAAIDDLEAEQAKRDAA
jgi:GTPase Era involved in 16S rRNA processing